MKNLPFAKPLLLVLAIVMTGWLTFGFTAKTMEKKSSRKVYSATNGNKYLPPDTNVFLGLTTQKKHGLITFTTALDNTFYLSDSNNQSGYIYLEAKADKFVQENSARLPLNISLVLDHSGSMSGDKMNYVKEAAKFVVDNLSSEDYLSIVVYDDEVKTLHNASKVTDKAVIKSKIESVYADGSTNLSGGTLQGYNQVKTNFKKDYVNRVLLLSDGLANVGITDTAQLQKIARDKNLEHSITLSTFGVGADYNEDLMTGMAEYGSGNYYFIDAPDKIPQIFQKELMGLLNVVAQNATLEVELPDGVVLDYVFGYKYEQKGNKLIVNFRDVYSEETKGVLVKYNIKNEVNSQLSFAASLQFDDAASGERIKLSNEEMKQPTQNYELYRTHGNEMVLQQITLFEANRRMEMAMREVDRGNYTGARTLMQENTVYINQMKGVVNVNKEIVVLDSLNRTYNDGLKDIERKSEADKKVMQKRNKQDNYMIKKKK